MKAKLLQALYMFIGLLLIGMGVYSVFVIVTSCIAWYNSFTEGSKVTLAIAVISLISTIGSIVYTKIKEKKLQIDAANTSKKQKLYSRFTGDIIDLMADPELGNDGEYTKKFDYIL